MMIAPLSLIASGLSGLFQPQGPEIKRAVSTDSSGFTAFLESLSKTTAEKLKTAESLSIDGLQGKATTQSVVEGVMAAQESLQTMLAVRDKAVSAFQDVSRMTI